MNPNRRCFIKLGIASIAAVVISSMPLSAHSELIHPMPGKKRKFSDRNCICRSYVIRPEFTENPVWNSVKEFGCNKCSYEETCLFSGTRNTNKTHKTRTFMPEMWQDKVLTDFVNIK